MEKLKPKKKKMTIRESVNEKLKGTPYNFDLLEKKYSNDTMFHTMFDIKGHSIWYNQSLVDYSKVSLNENFDVNIIERIIKMNSEHPFADFLLNLLQEQPKEAKCKKFMLF